MSVKDVKSIVGDGTEVKHLDVRESPGNIQGRVWELLDEYPTEALREALVNAVAHRRYEQEGQKIQLEVK